MNGRDACNRGWASIFVLTLGLLLVLLTMSLITRQITEQLALRSFENRLQAHYLAESGMELALWQISQWADQSVESFLNSDSLERPPCDVLAGHVRREVILNLDKINHYRHTPLQPVFTEDTMSHSLRMLAEASSDGSHIVLTVQGNYGNARVAQRAVVQLPVIVTGSSVGVAEEGLYVKTMELRSRSQVLATWP